MILRRHGSGRNKSHDKCQRHQRRERFHDSICMSHRFHPFWLWISLRSIVRSTSSYLTRLFRFGCYPRQVCRRPPALNVSSRRSGLPVAFQKELWHLPVGNQNEAPASYSEDSQAPTLRIFGVVFALKAGHGHEISAPLSRTAPKLGNAAIS